MAKSPEQLSTLLGVAILPGVFEVLVYTEAAQVEEFYRSDFYEMLRNPESGLWHLSAGTLAGLYQQEQKNGFFVDPEEQS